MFDIKIGILLKLKNPEFKSIASPYVEASFIVMGYFYCIIEYSR